MRETSKIKPVPSYLKGSCVQIYSIVRACAFMWHCYRIQKEAMDFSMLPYCSSAPPSPKWNCTISATPGDSLAAGWMRVVFQPKWSHIINYQKLVLIKELERMRLLTDSLMNLLKFLLQYWFDSSFSFTTFACCIHKLFLQQLKSSSEPCTIQM